MFSTVRLVCLASALALATPAAAGSIGIYFNTGDVAFAYRDGWWDQNHRWHPWRNQNEWRWYRAHYARNYYDWNHSRDRDQGWHDRGWHKGWFKHNDRDDHDH
jgi:hypothetical protein